MSASTAASLSTIDAFKFQSSPILIERTTSKVEKYSRLLWIAKKQAQQKKRLHAPLFSAFSVSDYGELSPAAAELVDWLVDQHRRMCEQTGPRLDGCKPLELIREFNSMFQCKWQLRQARGRCSMQQASHGGDQMSERPRGALTHMCVECA